MQLAFDEASDRSGDHDGDDRGAADSGNRRRSCRSYLRFDVAGICFDRINRRFDGCCCCVLCFEGVYVKEKLAATLEAESGTNDPMAMFLTITCIELISGHGSGVLSMIGSFIWEMEQAQRWDCSLVS